MSESDLLGLEQLVEGTPAWAVPGEDGSWVVEWPGQDADHYELLCVQDGSRGVETLAQGADLAALVLPKDFDYAVGHYAVVATTDGRPSALSAVGFGERSGKADLAAHLSRWKNWGGLAPQDPDKKTSKGEPQVTYVNGVKRTQQSWSATKTPDEIVTFNPNTNMLFPGAIVQADPAIGRGHLVPAQIEDSERAPLTVVVDALTSGNSVVVPEPNYGSVLDAIKETVAGKKNASPNIVFRKTEGYSSTETALALNLSASYLGFSSSLNVEAQRKEYQNTLVVYLRERAFIASCAMSTPNALINDSFTEERLTRLVNLGTMGETNPPMIVSDVSYGRILTFSFTSKATETEINAAVSASYNGFANISAELKARYKSVISNSEISVLSQGGDPKIIQSLLMDGNIGNYFGEPHDLDEYSIIGYVLKTLDGHLAKMSETTDYDRVSWEGGATVTLTLSNNGSVFGVPTEIDGKTTHLNPGGSIVSESRTFTSDGDGTPFRVRQRVVNHWGPLYSLTPPVEFLNGTAGTYPEDFPEPSFLRVLWTRGNPA
ncbi:thiol-activated cytolysin family protein [Kitasatospora sp. NPDC127067]|uniref:thiol-activated cytolysin family protein n=1 Tax=Kitasatospora sp. NPDC127067 TaxID=3347126 RepID=UPI00364A8F85